MVQVVTPAAGGPAEGAGIRPQDAILAIGDKSTEGMSLFEAASLLQVRPLDTFCGLHCEPHVAHVLRDNWGTKLRVCTFQRQLVAGSVRHLRSQTRNYRS